MLIPAFAHLFDFFLVPQIQCFELPPPSQCFGMMGVPFFPFGKYVPYGVQLTVFAKQVITA